MATPSRTCSRRLGSRSPLAFLMTITLKSLQCLLAIHRSCFGCIIRFDKDARISGWRNFFLLIGPDSGGKSPLHLERRKFNLPFDSFALDFVASGRAILFERTMRSCGSCRRLFQESWSVRFESFPAATDAESRREEDEACVAAPEFAKL